ncbi:MAG TPA: c-type cytochrome domain-containing protein [Verrucomicrobiae bacterium]
MVKHWKRIVLSGLGIAALHTGLNTEASAQEKVNYQDHIVPIFRNNCFKCHSQDTSKGDLDLSTFGAALKGGSSGSGLSSGDPDGSKLFKVVAHTEEPKMPPNSKITDKELELIKKWIAGGLLENSGSKAIASSAPKVDMTVDLTKLGKPDGPPALPQDWLLEPSVRTDRTTAVLGVASSPWAPVVALTGQHQVLVYNTDTLELSGVVKFPSGHPVQVRFSRNGKMLLAAGGEGAKIGLATVWDVVTGDKIITVGEEFDTVLASDLSADQKWIALGGPSKLVKIYSTADGQQKYSLKKHTDWVTAAEFSPNGKYLATGDRVGGILVWEPATGTQLYSMRGHRGSITQLSWRADSGLLLSASEDGTARTWKVEDEQQVRSINAHNGGVLSGSFDQTGNIITAGRDKQVAIWDANGTKKKSFAVTNDIPVRAALTHDSKRAVASDWAGNIYVWNAEDGKLLGELSANPPTLEQRFETVQKEIEATQVSLTKLNADLATAKEELAAVEGQQADKVKLDAAKKKIADTEAAIQVATAQIDSKKTKLTEIQAAQFNVKVYAAKDAYAVKEADHQKLLGSIEDAKGIVASADKDIAKAKKQAVNVTDRWDGLKNIAKFDKRFADEAAATLKDAQKAAGKIEAKVKKAEASLAKAKLEAQETLKKEIETLRKELEPLQKKVTESQAAVTKCNEEIEATKTKLVAIEKEASEADKKIKNLIAQSKKAQSEVGTAESRVEKSKKDLDAEKLKVDSLAAEYKKLKPQAPVQAAKS